jgi:hypothetical protein
MDPLTIAAIGSSLAGPLIGGLISGRGAERAAAAQAEAANRAAALQEARYQETKGMLSPWMQSGQRANQRLEGLVEGMAQPGWSYQQPDFQFDRFKDPGAQYIMQQAMQALSSSSLSRGATGGGALKAMQTQAADLANTGYQSAFDRYLRKSAMDYGQASDKYARDLGWQNNVLDRNQAMSAQGAGSGQALAGFGAGAAERAGGYMAGAGDARAAGIMGNANAMAGIASGLGQGISSGLGYLVDEGKGDLSKYLVDEGKGDLSKYLNRPAGRPARDDWRNA